MSAYNPATATTTKAGCNWSGRHTIHGLTFHQWTCEASGDIYYLLDDYLPPAYCPGCGERVLPYVLDAEDDVEVEA